MLFGNRGPRSSAARGRGEDQRRFQPVEERYLLSMDVGGQSQPGSGSNRRAYLVFGSLSTASGNVDWKTLIANQRVGDLGQLGNGAAGQQNPITGTPGFTYS